MKLSRTVDNLRFMENELKREHGKKPKHETLVRIRTFENAIKELEGERWIPVTEPFEYADVCRKCYEKIFERKK